MVWNGCKHAYLLCVPEHSELLSDVEEREKLIALFLLAGRGSFPGCFQLQLWMMELAVAIAQDSDDRHLEFPYVSQFPFMKELFHHAGYVVRDEI